MEASNRSNSKNIRYSSGDEAEMSAELRLLVAVQGHPNVEELVGLFDNSGMPDLHSPSGLILATKRCEVGSLHFVVRRMGTYEESEALQLAHDLLQALAHVHACGVVHGHVSSKTILIKRDGAP